MVVDGFWVGVTDDIEERKGKFEARLSVSDISVPPLVWVF